MRLTGFLVFLLSLFCTYSSFAQPKSELTQSRILILLDESSSMLQKWPSGKEKFKAADEVILRIMDSVYAVNSQVEFSLRVFGHQYTVDQKNCYDTRNEVPFSKDNRTQMSLRLEDIRPLGVTPIAYALTQAAKFDLVDEVHNAYSIILITDGGESCGGDICEVMKKLMKYKVYFKPYIISLEDDPALKTTYSCMGEYLQVTKDADIPKAVNTIVTAFRPLLRISKTDYKEIQTIAANTPSVLKVNIPEIKVTESDIQKPVKKADTVVKPMAIVPKDTVAKPETKIKVDVQPAKLPVNNIARLKMTGYGNVYTAIPSPKAIKAASLPSVEIVVPPAIERIAPMELASGKTLAITEPVLKKVKSVEKMPVVNIVVPTEQEHISGMALAKPRQFNTAPPAPKNVDQVRTMPVVDIKFPATLSSDNITRLAPAQPQAFTTRTPALKNMTAVQPGVKLPPVVIDEPPAPKNKAEQIARLTLASYRHIQILIVIEEKSIVPVKMPPLPPMKIDLPKVAAPVKPVAEKETPGPKKAEYTIEREDAKETTVEVYLTNGKGKYFNSTPQMLLLDPVTNNIVKSFYRTVDASGNPDPQTTLPVGTFNIALSAKKSLEVKNVKIEAGKKNKIVVIVKPCTLSFEYAKAPNRPVVEFVARVIERNKVQGGRVQDQRCNERLEYEPGNYHIMINTFPQIDRNEDIDFNEAVITIPQPGFAKFVYDDRIKTTDLYKQEGDKFLYFHTLNLSDVAVQPLRIQPGMYEAHFRKAPAIPGAKDIVITFLVKATETVIIELR